MSGIRHVTTQENNCDESYIKEICERTAQLCRIANTSSDTFYAHVLSNRHSSDIKQIVPKKQCSFPEVMFSTNQNTGNLVRDWDDLQIGEKYYMWTEKTIKKRKIYVLKHIVTELHGDTLNLCIMKQCSKPKTKSFTLTETDCKHLDIEFETGLEVYPVNLGWMKYKK